MWEGCVGGGRGEWLVEVRRGLGVVMDECGWFLHYHFN